MSINTYDKSDSVRVQATFSVDSVNTDPSTITLKVKNPAGTTSTYTYAGGTITRSAAGIYYKDITIDDDGMWYYRFEGTGAVVAASEHSFKVRTSEF